LRLVLRRGIGFAVEEREFGLPGEA
jgi:hypothetical protein